MVNGEEDILKGDAKVNEVFYNLQPVTPLLVFTYCTM